MISTELFAKVAIWITLVVWSAGGMFSRVMDTSEEVESLKVESRHHVAQPGHPIALERMNTVMLEQRELRTEVKDLGQSVAAICQATGAICE